MDAPDLVVSLGHNCRNAWNVRNRFGSERAYPFDWWITPAVSMLAMIDPGFRFEVAREDLTLIYPWEGKPNSVFNHRLGLFHQHDFARDPASQDVLEMSAPEIDAISAKSRALFDRLHDDVAQAQRPLFVISGLDFRPEAPAAALMPAGWGEPVEPQCTITAIRGAFGEKAEVLFVGGKAPGVHALEGGLIVSPQDDGTRLDLPATLSYVEPVNVYRQAFDALGLG